MTRVGAAPSVPGMYPHDRGRPAPGAAWRRRAASGHGPAGGGVTRARRDAAATDLIVRRGVERRAVVLLAAAVLFVEVFGLRQLGQDPSDGVALLYVVPVALAALELGLVAGLAAAGLAIGLTGLWAATAAAGLGALGLFTRAVVFLAVGGIAGRFGDRMRAAQRRQDRLLRSGVELARLDQAGDLALALAAHAAHVVDARAVRVVLGDLEAVEGGWPGPGACVLPIGGAGVLEVELARTGTLADEDRAALAMLALQARVALDNRALLQSERERRVLQAELREARGRLAERGRQLRGVIDTQERERREVAHELREQVAQELAAVLLGLSLLERDLEAVGRDGQLGELREHVDSTMGSLSALAVALRPSVLDGIGLAVALERLPSSGRAPGLERVDVELGDGADRLDPEVETAIYRVVEDAARAMEGPRRARVSADPAGDRLTVRVRSLGETAGTGDLTVLRARLELLGGRVEEAPSELVARMPLRAPLR